MKNSTKRLAGIIGWPISHSLSPKIHGFWLKTHKIEGEYLPLETDPEHLEYTLETLFERGFRGANVTLPHKEEAMKFMKFVSPQAEKLGAINTIIVHENGDLEGRNTDMYGFTENLKAASFALKSDEPIVAVLGAGGAARAVVAALQEMNFYEIRIINRTMDKARRLAEDLGGNINIFEWNESEKAMAGAELLVNATSLGMEGQPPLDIEIDALSDKAWVADIVYAPLQTELLKRAAKRGNKTIDGLGMLLHQARPAFKAWFGVDPEVNEKLRKFVLEKE